MQPTVAHVATVGEEQFRGLAITRRKVVRVDVEAGVHAGVELEHPEAPGVGLKGNHLQHSSVQFSRYTWQV